MNEKVEEVRKLLINISLDWSDQDYVYKSLNYIKKSIPDLIRNGNIKLNILLKIYEEVVLMMNEIEESRDIDGRVFTFVNTNILDDNDE